MKQRIKSKIEANKNYYVSIPIIGTNNTLEVPVIQYVKIQCQYKRK
jgi:hypothetical protein